VGDGLDPGTDMGPVQNRPQLDRVRSLVADAEARGAEVFFRGDAPDGPGYWHPVTLVRYAGEDSAGEDLLEPPAQARRKERFRVGPSQWCRFDNVVVEPLDGGVDEFAKIILVVSERLPKNF